MVKKTGDAVFFFLKKQGDVLHYTIRQRPRPPFPVLDAGAAKYKPFQWKGIKG